MALAIDQSFQVSHAAVNELLGSSPCWSAPVSFSRESCCWWSALMAALPSVAGWLAASAGGCPPAGALAPGIGQALMAAGSDGAGAGLFGLVDELPLAGLDAGLEGPFGDRRGALLGELLVLLEPGASHSRAEGFDLFPSADPPPLLGQRGVDRPSEHRVKRHELAHRLRTHPATWSDPAGLVAVGSRLVGAWHPGRRGDAALPTAAGGAAKLATGCAFLLADGAVAAGATAVLQRPLIALGSARPHAGQPEPDAGLGDDLQQPGGATVAAGLLRYTIVEVVGVPGVVAGVLVALLEVQQVHPALRRILPVRPWRGWRSIGGRGEGLSAHGRPPI